MFTIKNLDSAGEKIFISSLVAGVALALPAVVESTDVKIDYDNMIKDSNGNYFHEQNHLKVRNINELQPYQLNLIDEQKKALDPRAHATIRRFMKLKKLNIGAVAGQETLSTLFINKNINGIEVDDQILVKMKEGRIFQYGDEGKAVKEIQYLLSQAGYFHYEQDSIYGSRTVDAVKQYQKENGLFIDGVFGTQTYEHLTGVKVKVQIKNNNSDNSSVSVYSASSELSPPSPQVTETVKIVVKNNIDSATLQSGDTGKAVEELQKLLKKKGYFDYKIDGIFGPATESSVRNYQINHRLISDGIAGRKTINHLKTEKVTLMPSRSAMVVQEEKKNNDTQETISITTNTDLIAAAKSLQGTPYLWGGTTRNGFDCSGYLMYVFKRTGINIPRTVTDIWNYGSAVETKQPGDIVFFETYKKGPSHAGIYLGNNKFIHAGSSTGVTISDLDMSYWKTRYLGAKRIK